MFLGLASAQKKVEACLPHIFFFEILNARMVVKNNTVFYYLLDDYTSNFILFSFFIILFSFSIILFSFSTLFSVVFFYFFLLLYLKYDRYVLRLQCLGFDIFIFDITYLIFLLNLFNDIISIFPKNNSHKNPVSYI